MSNNSARLLFLYLVIRAHKSFEIKAQETARNITVEKYQELALSFVNYLRAKHRSPPLEFDEEILQNARDCAQHYSKINKLDHSCIHADDHGENLARLFLNGSATAMTNREVMVKQAISLWYSEESGYDYKRPWLSTGVFGHFTHLVWESSKIFGFAAVENQVVGAMFVVALFDPSGNIFVSGGGSNAYHYQLFIDNVKPPRNRTPVSRSHMMMIVVLAAGVKLL